ncbi:hypothetical protein NL676_035573 [Syzygium grande]|nr:hypothetical protein NL676_035573 [Syzygium grande]
MPDNHSGTPTSSNKGVPNIYFLSNIRLKIPRTGDWLGGKRRKSRFLFSLSFMSIVGGGGNRAAASGIPAQHRIELRDRKIWVLATKAPSSASSKPLRNRSRPNSRDLEIRALVAKVQLSSLMAKLQRYGNLGARG